jgi:hypothetical protein
VLPLNNETKTEKSGEYNPGEAIYAYRTLAAPTGNIGLEARLFCGRQADTMDIKCQVSVSFRVSINKPPSVHSTMAGRIAETHMIHAQSTNLQL